MIKKTGDSPSETSGLILTGREFFKLSQLLCGAYKIAWGHVEGEGWNEAAMEYKWPVSDELMGKLKEINEILTGYISVSR